MLGYLQCKLILGVDEGDDVQAQNDVLILHIGDNVVVQAQSGITKSLDAGKSYFGSPAEETRKKLKELAMIRQLPEMYELLKKHE